jgi:hypothetical protein
MTDAVKGALRANHRVSDAVAQRSVGVRRGPVARNQDKGRLEPLDDRDDRKALDLLDRLPEERFRL